MEAGSGAGTPYLRLHTSFVLAGALALGAGSAMLLVGAAAWLAGGGEGAFVLRYPAIAVHFLGWTFLLASLFPLSVEPRSAEIRHLAGSMQAAWLLSVVGAIVGIWTLPIAFDRQDCTIICFSFGALLAARFYFPYVPSVFAVVVVCHAFIFRSEPRLVGRPLSGALRSGVGILFGLAAVSAGIQAAGWFSGGAFLLAGLTAVGYFLAAAGLRRQLPDTTGFTAPTGGADPRVGL